MSTNEKQRAKGDCKTNLTINVVEREKSTKQYDSVVDEFNSIVLDNRSQTSKLCKEPKNIRSENQSQNPEKLKHKLGNVNQKNLSKLKLILPEYHKIDLSKVTSKVNCWSDKKQPSTATTTSSSVSGIKNVKKQHDKTATF